ncbi:hypothetical protein ACVOMV_31200 [Mesorhizobium atlanticum]
MRSVTPVFQTQKRHTTTLNRHAGFRTWHPSRSQFAGAPCTFTRLLPIDSKDGQRWLTNPSTNRRFGDGPYEKEPSMVFATVKMLSLTRFAARFSGLCQETVNNGTTTSSAG